jgi:hypothetical protein
MINTGNYTKKDMATLQQIKHSNDKNLNPQWGTNGFHGTEDQTKKALKEMGRIYESQQK